jgi:hypothetical protein
MAWSVAGNIKGPQGPAGADGAQGPQGPQGNIGPAGPAGLNWRGAWSNANAYAANDSVSWGGSTYFATVSKIAGSAPPTGTSADPGTNDAAVNSGWAALSLEGATGPAGPQGSVGPQGPQGNVGPQGTAGATGTRGSQWYTGTGAPVAGNTAGSIPGDKYLDTTSGDVYTLT